MASKIICDTVVGKGANIWFGTLVVSNIRYEDGSSVTLDNFLFVKFKYPVSTTPVANVPELILTIDPWQPVVVEVIANDKINGLEMGATVKIKLSKGYTLTRSDMLTWAVNGDLTSDPIAFTESFKLYAESIPSE